MDKGSRFPRAALLVMFTAILVLAYLTFRSMEHQQRQIARIEDRLTEVLQGRWQAPVEAPQPDPSQASSYDQYGKDAIGRPSRARPDYTIFPPLGEEIPGWTTPRHPDTVHPLCGQYVQGYPSGPDKSNYYLTNSGMTTVISRFVLEKLFTVDLDDPQKLRPELAVAWETAPDKMTFVFHLRKGVVFSDGTPFDADDVLFTFHLLRDPEVDIKSKRGEFEDVESVVKIDPYTVEVRMRRPYWKALRQFGYTLLIYPREWFEKEIPRRAAELGISSYSVEPGEPGFAAVFNTIDRTMPPGTGPYMWKEGESWEPNVHITIFANPTSWYRKYNPDHYRLERLKWRFISDSVAREQAFLTGEIDVLGIDQDTWYTKYANDPEIDRMGQSFSYDHIGLLYTYMIFNCRTFPFDDRNVRLAIAHLMDRQRLVDEILRGHGRIATCPTKPIYPEYSLDIEPHRYDPNEARRVLAESGWSDTDGDGVLDKEGRMLEFSISVPSSLAFYTTVTTMLQQACEKVGIRCHADPKTWSLFMEDLYSRNFQSACAYAHAQDPWIDLYEELHSSMSGPGQGNYAGWSNREADKLLEAMRGEFDDERRVELFHQLNRTFYDDLPWLLFVHTEVRAIVNRRVHDVTVRPTGLRPRDFWVECDPSRL